MMSSDTKRMSTWTTSGSKRQRNDQQRAILKELAKEEINNENDSTIEGNRWETNS